MGHETFKKRGAQSRMDSSPATKVRMTHTKEHMDQPCPPLGGGAEPFVRSFENDYKKQSLRKRSRHNGTVGDMLRDLDPMF